MTLDGTAPLKTSEVIILKKAEYSESSLIINVLTSDAGQLNCIVKGARKNGRKVYPQVDLFREVRIIYNVSSKSNLISVRDIELLRTYDTIALNSHNFKVANWLCRFTLKNTKANIDVANVYQALRVAFHRLSSKSPAEYIPVIMPFCIVTLADNGLLPAYSPEVNAQSGFDQMIKFALDFHFPCPQYPESVWKNLAAWTHRFIVGHTDLVLPDAAFLRQ